MGAGSPGPRELGPGGCRGGGLDLRVQAGSGDHSWGLRVWSRGASKVWGRHQGTGLIPPGWGYRGLPPPQPLSHRCSSARTWPGTSGTNRPLKPCRECGGASSQGRGVPEGGWGHTVCPRPTSRSPRATLICAWAEEGADALGPNGELVHSDAFPPETLVDTLGAGDTFNAAVIFALAEGGHKRGTAAARPWFSLARPRHSQSTATSHPGPHPQGGPCRMPSPSAAGSRAGNVGSRASTALSELVPGDLCSPQARHICTAPSNPPINPHVHRYCLLCPLAVPPLPWLGSHRPWDALTTAKDSAVPLFLHLMHYRGATRPQPSLAPAGWPLGIPRHSVP